VKKILTFQPDHIDDKASENFMPNEATLSQSKEENSDQRLAGMKICQIIHQTFFTSLYKLIF
jgi:hypothetical protein